MTDGCLETPVLMSLRVDTLTPAALATDGHVPLDLRSSRSTYA